MKQNELVNDINKPHFYILIGMHYNIFSYNRCRLNKIDLPGTHLKSFIVVSPIVTSFFSLENMLSVVNLKGKLLIQYTLYSVTTLHIHCLLQS